MRGTNDTAFLAHAARLAERGLGRTWPNPTVGCVIVQGDTIVGAARTADGGRPHAETQAMAMAGNAARGATAYVTLEPCAHHGKTPPCVQALIDAGVARVVIGYEDPDPRVSGKGIAMLQAAGIEVALSTIHHPPSTNRGFFRRVTHGMPYVSMKLATSSDFFMARNDAGGQWLTGEFARQHGHRIRAQHDAILTGIGTALADDPRLDVRPPIAQHPSFVRVVADRNLRLPLASKLVKTASTQPVWLLTHTDAIEQNASHATELRERGVKFLVVEDAALTPETILKTLAAEGITRLLIEAGPTLSAAFLAQNRVDTLHWYRAPFALGNAGAAPINALEGVAAGGTHIGGRALGDDTYACYELTTCSPD